MADTVPATSTATPAVTGAMPPSLVQQGAACATAAVDLVPRTALASVLGMAAVTPIVRVSETEREAERVGFYCDLAERGDATETFVAPPPVEVRANRRRPPRWLRGVGLLDSLSFESPFRARHPDVELHHPPDHPNRIARAQHWRHPEGPQPTIIVLHGFAASPPVFNSAFFSLPWFYGNGCDVLLVTLPFHGRRAQPVQPLDGIELFSGGLVRMNEGLLQAVSDIRSLIDHLFATGVPQVGVTGLSLGGYLTAALAAAEPRLAFAIPNAPAVDIGSLAKDWFPVGQAFEALLRRRGQDYGRLREAMSVSSALRYPPAIERHRLFVIGGLGDRFTPPSQARQLYEHWGRCRIHWYPGNHVVHLQRGEYLREVGRFLRTIGFSEGRPHPQP